MKPQSELFFQAAQFMSKNVAKIHPRQTNDIKDWQHRISPQHLSDIFSWIFTNQTMIETELTEPPHAVFFNYEETNLYLSFELVTDDDGVIHLFLSSKSKLASTTSDTLKEKEQTHLQILDGVKKSKVINSGGFKEVQYCFHWRPGMKDLEIYTVAVVNHADGIKEIKCEEKFSRLIGSEGANIGLRGVRRIKHGQPRINYYSPLAISDQWSWTQNKEYHGLIGMEHTQFLTVLYKQARILLKLQNLGIFWRDLKRENFLMVPSTTSQSVKPLAIDFSYARKETDDEKELKNDFGSLEYMSPWNDTFLELRKIKLEELLQITKLKQMPTDSRAQRKEIEAQIQYYKRLFKTLSIQIITTCPGCTHVINAINQYKKPADLFPPSRFPLDKSLTFLSSHLDDAWAFSKLMTQLISVRRRDTTETKLNGELVKLHNYFQENMNRPWRSMHTGQMIVDNLKNLFEEMGLNITSVPRVKISSVHFLNSKAKEEKQRMTHEKLPGRFFC